MPITFFGSGSRPPTVRLGPRPFAVLPVLRPFNAPAQRVERCESLIADAQKRLKFGPGKKWEHYKLNKNGNPIRIPMHVKCGDLVQVRAGDDKGKIGKVTRVLRKIGQIVVEGVNFKTKHVKPMYEGQKGHIEVKEYPIHHSNVAHYSSAHSVFSRVGWRRGKDGKKIRFLKKTGEILE